MSYEHVEPPYTKRTPPTTPPLSPVRRSPPMPPPPPPRPPARNPLPPDEEETYFEESEEDNETPNKEENIAPEAIGGSRFDDLAKAILLHEERFTTLERTLYALQRHYGLHVHDPSGRLCLPASSVKVEDFNQED